MRISLTALTSGGPRDVVVEGDDDMTVSSVARSLSGLGPGHDGNVARIALYSEGRMLDPSGRAARLLRDGAVVALDSEFAPATVQAEPGGPQEVR
ncbi:hypothetical protein, partial [Actinocorallia lasiicapitis]